MFRPKVVSHFVSDRVDRLLVIVRVDFAPGQVTVALADSIEIAQTFHTADISVQQQMDQAVVTGPSNSGESVQENLDNAEDFFL